MQGIDDTDLSNLLAALGVPDTPTNGAQLAVLLAALAIFTERNELRGDLWQEFPIDEEVRHLRSKVARVEVGITMTKDGELPGQVVAAIVDDALDIINYAAFLIRKARA